MKRSIFLFILLVNIALFPDCSLANVQELDLAYVNGERLTLEQLKFIFSDRHGGHTGMLADEDLLRRFINSMIDERLLIQEAYNLSIDKDVEKKPDYINLRNKLLKDALFKSEVLDRVIITDEMVKKAYEKLSVLYHGRMIRVGSESEALEAYKKLNDGESFEALASRVSIDQTAKHGGDLGLVAWGALDEPIESVLFALADGSVSKPFPVKTGWVILLLEERKDSTPPEFGKVSKNIHAIMEKRKTGELKEQFYDRLYSQYEVSIDKALLKKDAFLEAISDDRKQESEKIPVATFKGGKILLSEFAKGLNPAKISGLNAFEAEMELEDRIERMIDDALLNNIISAREMTPEGRRILNYFKEKLMIEELYNNYIMKDITVSDREIESYYKDHQNEFETPRSAKLRVISSRDREKLEAARSRIAQGADFGVVAADVSEDRSTAVRGGDLGWISKGMLPEKVDEQIFSLKAGDVTGIVEFPDCYKIYKIEDMKGSRIRTLDEVKEKIKIILMKSKGSAEKNTWLAKLKKGAKIRIIEKNVKKGAEILQAEFNKKIAKTAASAESPKEESRNDQEGK